MLSSLKLFLFALFIFPLFLIFANFNPVYAACEATLTPDAREGEIGTTFTVNVTFNDDCNDLKNTVVVFHLVGADGELSDDFKNDKIDVRTRSIAGSRYYVSTALNKAGLWNLYVYSDGRQRTTIPANLSIRVNHSAPNQGRPPGVSLPQADPLGPGPAGVQDLQRILERLPNVGVALAFIALTGVLVWAGIKFLTSGGDAKQVQSAYDIVTWAVLGVFFLAVAWLVLLLIENFTGVEITKFCIGFNCGLP